LKIRSEARLCFTRELWSSGSGTYGLHALHG
jgi:hypothetical protein